MGVDRKAAASAWIRRAANNLTLADAGLSTDPEVECFLAQQAAEMAVKAVFLARGVLHPRTHNIAELLKGLERMGVSIPDEVDDAADLTDYATDTRYADVEQTRETVSPAERREAVRLARIVLEWAKAEIARTE